MKRYFDTWLELAEKNGVIASLYDHWILGRDDAGRLPRWSIMRNVLGWGASHETTEPDSMSRRRAKYAARSTSIRE